jgi:hypothetical protein
VSLSLVLGIVLSATSLRGDEPKAGQPQLDPAAMEKLMAEYARVTDKHEGFKHLVGRWTTEMKCNMSSAGPQTGKGQATFRLLLGGRFLQQSFQGTMGDQNFQGLGISGYDNAQKKYVGVWMDSMGTGIMHTTGSYDEKTHVMTELGEFVSPAGPMKMKMVTKPVDENKFTFTMSMLSAEGEQKMIEIIYTRAADGEKAPAKNTDAKPSDKAPTATKPTDKAP